MTTGAEAGAALCFAAESNTGLHRTRNEDSFCLLAEHGVRNQLAVVADGVGGHADGALASFLCCRRMLLDWRAGSCEQLTDQAALIDRVSASVLAANREILQQNLAVHHTPPMCTTVVAAVFTPERVLVFHVGDSRLLVCRGEEMTQITVDHARRENATQCNIISRALGARAALEVEIDLIDREAGDRYLLCSDGLFSNLSDVEIAALQMQAETPRRAVNALMRAALLAGGVDNISVICAF